MRSGTRCRKSQGKWIIRGFRAVIVLVIFTPAVAIFRQPDFIVGVFTLIRPLLIIFPPGIFTDRIIISICFRNTWPVTCFFSISCCAVSFPCAILADILKIPWHLFIFTRFVSFIIKDGSIWVIYHFSYFVMESS